MSARKLKPNEIDWILDDAFTSMGIDQTLNKIEMSRRQFAAYLRYNPEFNAEYELALVESCVFLENDMLNATKKFKDSHKLAAIHVNAIAKVLAFRNPQRYGAKIDLNVNQTISIKANLDASTSRLESVIKDVTPLLSTPTI